MCSIIGSFDKEKIKELININLYRGNFTFSITEINNSNIIVVTKVFTSISDSYIDNIKFNTNSYYIIHIQAPTNSCGLNESNIHPAYYKKYGNCIWHNGIILQKDMDYLSNKYFNNEKYTWDTKLLLDLLSEYSFKVLNNVEGSFACIYYHDKNLYMFRTTSSPLYIDDKLNISSTQFNNSKMIDSGIVFKLDFLKKEAVTKSRFICKDNPYLFF